MCGGPAAGRGRRPHWLEYSSIDWAEFLGRSGQHPGPMQSRRMPRDSVKVSLSTALLQWIDPASSFTHEKKSRGCRGHGGGAMIETFEAASRTDHSVNGAFAWCANHPANLLAPDWRNSSLSLRVALRPTD